MITDKQAEESASDIRDKAPEYAKAKANRIYLSEFRKTKKALLMNQKIDKPAHVKEAYAYAHPDYNEVLKGLQEAVETEEKLHWEIISAQAFIEIWRTQSANSRALDSSHR